MFYWVVFIHVYWVGRCTDDPIIALKHGNLLRNQVTVSAKQQSVLKGIVHFEIKIWYLSAYPKGIQDVGVFFSSVDPILTFLG